MQNRMHTLYILMMLSCCFGCNSSIFAKQILINTNRSALPYLQSDTCTFDDQTNTVQCAKYGAFQNIKKIEQGSGTSQGQLLGTMVMDNKNYTIYALDPAQAISQKQDLLATISATAAVLFNPVESVDDKGPKPNPYPLLSQNAAAVDALFGPRGLNVDKSIIQYFKNFYFYLDYVIRLEYAARLIAYAHQIGIDGIDTVEKKSWQDLVTLLEQKAGGWKGLENKLFDPALTPDLKAIRGLIVAASWQEVITTSFGTSLNRISLDSIKRSGFWQKYIKYIITKSYVQDQSILLSIKQVEETIFKYIPNIEVAYYTPDFTSLRNASEMFHISLILTDALRARHVPQCLEWASLPDQQKIFAATQDFKTSPFYSIASYAEQEQSTVYADAAQNKVGINMDLFKDEPLLQEELLILSMIKVLHALTNYLYDSDHLDHTMSILANKTILKPVPSIFIYAPDDYVYLEDLNLLHNSMKASVTPPPQQQHLRAMAFAQGSQAHKKENAMALFNSVMNYQKKVVNPQARVQNFWGDLFNDAKDAVDKIEDAGKKVWEDLKKFGGDVVDFATDAGDAIWEEAEAIGFGTAAVFLSGLNPQAAEALLKRAKNLQEEIAKHIDKAKNELESTVDDVENIAKDSVNVLATAMEGICDMTTANYDKELCKSLGGAFESAFDMVISEISGDLKSFVSIAGGMVKLTADGINLITNVAADVATQNYVGLESDLVSGLKQFGADAAVAILEPLTIQFQYFIKMLADALRFCQYFISILTRIFIDATTAVTFAIGATFGEFANLFGANINPSEWAKTVDTALTEHERLIGTAITTGLLLATIPFTGGASIPLIAMTVGPQLFAMYGSWQADEEARKQKQEEDEFVQDFGKYVANNETIYKMQQEEWSDELNTKFISELENQERNLGYYENLLANNFEALKEQIASALGSYWMQMLTPDKTFFNMIPADLGYIYGISTGVYELNPSQGFSLFSSARNSFSQEIAVAPEAAMAQDDSSQMQNVASKNWFNQKEVTILDKPATQVEIRLQAIYVLNSFYIGLYFGGQDIDIENVKKTGQAPVDLSNLAKMAVFKKEDDKSSATFGIYEHEGKGWLVQDAQAPKFQLGTWYHIQMQLQGTNLQVKVWDESKPESATSLSYTVSAPSPSQKIVGVISSGAAVEYQFVPAIVGTPNSTLRPVINNQQQICALPCDFTKPQFVPLQTEQDREKQARSALRYALQPTIGNLKNLTAVGKMQILRGQYIYNTPSTNVHLDGKVVNDYVVPCIADQVGVEVEIEAGSIGSYPRATSYLVSLVSEKLFDSAANSVNTKLSNVYDAYVKQFGPLTDSLDQQIKSLRTKYASQGSTITVGSFTVQANKDALQNQLYIYNAPLKDSKGAILKDQKGAPITDYFLLALLNTVKNSYENIPGNPGISYSDMLTYDSARIGVLSLVTGNLYTAQSTVPVKTYSASWMLSNYQRNYGVIPDSIKNLITQAQQAYKTATQAPEGAASGPDTGPAGKKVDPKDVSTKSDNKGSGSGKLLPLQPPASKSIQQQTQEASGGEFSFGGPS